MAQFYGFFHLTSHRLNYRLNNFSFHSLESLLTGCELLDSPHNPDSIRRCGSVLWPYSLNITASTWLNYRLNITKWLNSPCNPDSGCSPLIWQVAFFTVVGFHGFLIHSKQSRHECYPEHWGIWSSLYSSHCSSVVFISVSQDWSHTVVILSLFISETQVTCLPPSSAGKTEPHRLLTGAGYSGRAAQRIQLRPEKLAHFSRFMLNTRINH